MLVMDDDFVPLFLLLSCLHPSILALLLEAKLKHFLSLEELRKRDRRFPRCALVDARQSSFTGCIILEMISPLLFLQDVIV